MGIRERRPNSAQLWASLPHFVVIRTKTTEKIVTKPREKAMPLRKQLVRYLKAVEFVAPEVCNLHKGQALFQIRYVLVLVFALLKDG